MYKFSIKHLSEKCITRQHFPVPSVDPSSEVKVKDPNVPDA